MHDISINIGINVLLLYFCISCTYVAIMYNNNYYGTVIPTRNFKVAVKQLLKYEAA